MSKKEAVFHLCNRRNNPVDPDQLEKQNCCTFFYIETEPLEFFIILMLETIVFLYNLYPTILRSASRPVLPGGRSQRGPWVQPAHVQEDGEEEDRQERKVQDPACHLHGDQGGHNDGYNVRQHSHIWKCFINKSHGLCPLSASRNCFKFEKDFHSCGWLQKLRSIDWTTNSRSCVDRVGTSSSLLSWKRRLTWSLVSHLTKSHGCWPSYKLLHITEPPPFRMILQNPWWKSVAGNNLMLVQEVDEEKVEDPLTGLSGNSSDLSDSEKSSSMQDLKMKWAGDLTRSLSARRQRSGSRLDHPSYEAHNF